MSAIDTDLTVIGGGPGGMAAAIEAAKAGMAVVLVESGRLGGRAIHGTMLPWRSLERAVDDAGSAPSSGNPTDRRQTWAAAWAESRRLGTRWEQRVGLRLADAGVDRIEGRARFVSPHEIAVEAGPAIRFDRAIVAVGGGGAPLAGDPPDGRRLFWPDQLSSLEAPPDSLMVIGGGAAGAELIDSLSRLGGTQLTWVMDEFGILPRFERELAEAIGDVLMERGVKLVHGKAVASLSVAADQVLAKLEGGRTYAAEAAVLAVGTQPALDSLQLSAAGLAVDARGALRVDEHCRTDVAHLFAVGDCTLASENVAGAEAMGRCAGRAAAGLEPAPWRPSEVPRVVWTRPAAAQVGATPEQVAGREVQLHTLRLEESVFGLLRGVAERDEAKGFIRVVSDSESGRLLGASAVGPRAPEIVSAVALALRVGATDSQIADVFTAVPGGLDALTRAVR